MPKRTQLIVLLVLVFGVYFACLAALKQDISRAMLQPFSIVVGVVSLVLVLFDRWLWKLRALHGWLVQRPFLGGTWLVELHSSWADPNSGEAGNTIEGYCVVRETLSHLQMHFLFEESSSRLVAERVQTEDDGSYRIYAVYQNEPLVAVRERSPIHYGALAISVPQGEGAQRLRGTYWTDRATRGDLYLKERKSGLADSFESARDLWRKP